MPEGPFGLPRMTDFGPFVDTPVEVAQIEFVEEEKRSTTHPDAVARNILPRSSNYVSIEAVYDSRLEMEDPDDMSMFAEVIGVGDFIFDRQAGSTTYFYEDDVAWSSKTGVRDDFRRAGLGSELMLQKIDSMRKRGVEEVWALGATEAGRGLLEKHGFKRADTHGLYTRVIR